MMSSKKYIGIFTLLIFAAISASAQKAERDYIRKGNRLFKDSVYVDAEINYRKALETNPKSTVAMYNLANTLMLQNKLQEAMEQVALRCFYLCDFLLLQPSFYEYPLIDVVTNVLKTVVPTSQLQNSNLLCRVWVEEEWKRIKDEWKEENEKVALQSYHSFFFSSLSL